MTKARNTQVQASPVTDPSPATRANGRISLVPPAAEPATERVDACVRHTPAAMAISREEVRSSDRVDVVQVARNLRATQSVIEAHRDDIARTGVQVSWEAVAAGADLADALLIADAQVRTRAAANVQADLKVFNPLAALVVADAKTQVRKEVFDAAEVRAILRGGRSLRQRAKAVLQLAALYDALPSAVRERSALSPDELSRAVANAKSLLPKLKRASTPTPARDVRSPQRDLRDRVWTLAVQHHEMLGRLAGAVWGMKVSKMIPKLKTRSGVARRPRAVTPPTPAPLNDPTG